jgi:hypothetical protein
VITSPTLLVLLTLLAVARATRIVTDEPSSSRSEPG